MLTADVLISGAGPAGTACAMALRDSGLNVILMEKETFPRDKICGDAISVDVINQLPLLSAELEGAFGALNEKFEVPGIRIVSPGGRPVDLPFIYKGAPRPGFVSTRMDFDSLMAFHAKKVPGLQFMESCQVQDAETLNDSIQVRTTRGVFQGQMVVAADGAQSVFARKLGNRLMKAHHSAGLRRYFRGVSGMHADGYIELIFFRKLLPGYLWIFPLPEGRANVGLGVLSSEVSGKKLNLRKVFDDLINEHPDLKERFSGAVPLESPQGFGLPLGSEKRRLAGDRLILTGDAAGLIDPFSGEGIGNAIRSGRKAAEHVRQAFAANDFSAQFNVKYQQAIHDAMGREFRVSRALQKVCRYPFLFDWIAKKAADPYWHSYLMEALTDLNKKNRLSDPMLYLKMLFR